MTPQELKAEGNKAFAKQEYKKAAKIYRDAIKLDPSNPVLYSNRAQCFLKFNDFERAARDCTKGLELSPELPLRVKLYYRNGLALKSLNQFEEARASFEQALKLDPSNSLAAAELKSIEHSGESSRKKVKLQSDGFNIPINTVETLPLEYQKMIDPSGAPQKNPSTSTEDTGTKEKESFKRDAEPKKPLIQEVHDASRAPVEPKSPMHFLARLKGLPESEKLNAYKYVYELDPREYQALFGPTGIDTEFLEFYIESAAYISSHAPPDTWITKILQSLQTLCQFKRFSLSLEFCNRGHIDILLSKVHDFGTPDQLESYTSILG